MVQFPFRVLSKVTASAIPGTLNPPAPPETFDQLAALFQLEGPAETQKRAAAELMETLSNKTKHKQIMASLISIGLGQEYWKCV